MHGLASPFFGSAWRRFHAFQDPGTDQGDIRRRHSGQVLSTSTPDSVNIG